MPITAYHVATATSPDQPGVEINSNQWNSAHAMTLSALGSEIFGAFSNGGNVSFGLDGGGYVTASAVGGGTINQTGPNIAASNSTITSGTVIWSNSNNVSFGLINGTQMTASASYPTQTAYVFSNANGVSFGTNASTVTATVKTDYLTTAMASNAGSNFIPIGNSTAYQTSVLSGTFQTTGAYLTTARASTDAIGLNTALTANGVSVTANSSGLSLNFPAFLTTAQSPGAYLTTAMVSNAGSNFVAASGGITGTNITGTIYSNGMSLSVAAPGAGGGAALQGSGVYTQNTGTIQFANSNNITFGLSTNVMTASFSQSVDTNKAGIGYTSTTQGGSTVGITQNTAGLSAAWPAFVTAAGAGDGNNVVGFNAIATQASTTYIFSNSNNITFGVNAGTVTLSYSNTVPYITTAMVSDAGSRFISAASSFTAGPVAATINSNGIALNFSSVAGTTSGFTGGASISGSMTYNTAGLAISLSHPAWLTTAAQSSASNVSGIIAGTNATGGTATLSGNISFSNANGISFYTSAGNAVVGTVATNYQSQGAYLTTAMQTGSQSQLWVMGNSSGTIGGTNISGTVYSNGMSFSVAAPGGGGGAAISAAGNSQNTGTVSFGNGGGVSFGLSNNGVMTAAAPAGAPSPVNFSAGTASNNLASVVFADSNGMVFGLNTGASSQSITASYNDPDNWALYANVDGATSGTSASTIGTQGIYFKAGNNITLSGSSNSIVISGQDASWSLVGNTAGTNQRQLSAGKLYFSGGPNITLSGNSNTIVISAGAAGGGVTLAGGYTNINLMVNSATVAYAQSTSHVVPFILPNNWQWDFIRLNMLGAIIAASTTAATTGNSQFSCGYSKTHNFGIYSRGAGANSDSMQLVVSTSFGESFSNNISGATNSTQWSYSNRWTVPCSSGTLGFTYDYSSSAASINVNSAGAATGLTGLKYIDFPFATTLPAGKYWLMYGNSTTTATQVAGTTIGLRNYVTYNPAFVSQVTGYSIGTLGAATSNIYAPQKGLGSFTTAGGGTTASLHWTKVSNSAANPMLYFQLMESN